MGKIRNIVVVIPVVNKTLALGLLHSITLNDIRPSRVIIIDNTPSSQWFNYKTEKFNTEIIKRKRPGGVNESWNMGVSLAGNCDAVSILNDDLLLDKQFFQRNIMLFEKYPDCGVACPSTVDDQADMRLHDISQTLTGPMKKREGWAFTVRKELLDKIPAIPWERGFKTFCGDDWYWHWVKKHKFRWYKDALNIVWHKGSVSVKRMGLAKHGRKEKRIASEIINHEVVPESKVAL